jgi:peptidoglycan/LPS O-acetylase OafA/YrhL
MRSTDRHHARLAYAKGLDGVRALAVAAVLLYHLGTTGVLLAGGTKTFMPGGFLGVDVFFVLSGFLITSLLMAEKAQTGRISIKDFYIRRARRLLPALFTMMVAVALAAALYYTAQAHDLGGDLLAAFGYVTNWWLILKNSSYFGTGDHPPLLTHLWSLAVEEQFYLIWPLVLILLAGRRGRRTALTILTFALIAASTALAYVLFDPYADPSRVYYGTDTRAATPLIGALLAITLRPWRWRSGGSPMIGRLIDLAACTALAWLVIAAMTTSDKAPFLYHGGFLFIAVAAGLLVIGAAHPDSKIGGLLGIAPLRWLGERSYGIYLWHWPIFAVTQPGIDVPLGLLWSSVLRIALTVAAAELSFRFVEKPLRAGAIGKAIARWRAAGPARRRRMAARTAYATVLVLVVAASIGVKLATTKAPDMFTVGDETLGGLTPSVSPAPSVTASASPGPTAIPTLLTVPAVPPKVAIYGDSQGQTLLYYAPKDLNKYAKFYDHTIEGCGIMLGRVVTSSGEARNLYGCSSWLDTWRSRAAATKPDIAIVMLGAWDVFDLKQNEGLLKFNTPQWDAQWMGELNKGLDAIEESGATVALSLVPCFRPVARNRGHGAGYWPERGDDTRTRHVNELIRQVAAVRDLRLVEPPAAYCTDPKVASDRTLRWDGVHYTPKGSLQFLKAILPQLLAMPYADGPGSPV